MSNPLSTRIDAVLEKINVEDDNSHAADTMELPLGMFVPDSLERRRQEIPKSPSKKIYKKTLQTKISRLIHDLSNTNLDSNFITHLEVLSLQSIDQLWSQMEKSHDSRHFFGEFKSGHLVVYICRKIAQSMELRSEFKHSANILLQHIDVMTTVSLESIDEKYTQLFGNSFTPLAQWMPRSTSGLSGLGSCCGSSSGCSSPTSSIGAGGCSGVATVLTPRVHSKNPLITRILPWHVIKGFAQSDQVACVFEQYCASEESAMHGKEMYIFADCTVIALVRILLQNETFLASALQPSSPVKRRRDGVETVLESASELEVEHTIKSMRDYIQFISTHASDMHADDTVSSSTIIERHVQQLVPLAREYLRECDFEGF
jgi:hypothetical protein